MFLNNVLVEFSVVNSKSSFSKSELLTDLWKNPLAVFIEYAHDECFSTVGLFEGNKGVAS